jgi:PKD repeat protein
MRRLAAILGATVFAVSASAQFSVVIPNGYAATEGSTSNAFPWGRGGTGLRHQCIYDSSHFTNQGITYPILITGLKWRPNTAVALVASSYTSGCTVSLSTCPVDQAAVSTTMAANEGADLTTVFSGPVSWGAQPAQTGPTPFGISIPFTTNFVYDPNAGDLNIECDLPIQTFTGTGPQLDVEAGVTTSLASRVYISTGYPAGPGTIGLNHAVVVEVDYVPASGLFASFSATPTTGASPLTVNFTDHTFTSDPGGITSWAWDLDGDGIVDSTAQNPTFVYNSCGNFNVSLTVTDASHPSNTLTRNAYVVTDNVTANFTTSVIVPGVVQFTDTSVPLPTSWAWDLNGDGIVDSTAQNPVWNYGTTCSPPVNVTLTVNRLCRGPFVKTQAVSAGNSAATTLVGGNGNSSATAVGNMFDISALHPQGITICAMSVTPYSFAGPFTASVYVTPGTYVGNNLNASVWRLIGTGSGTSAAGPFANPLVVFVPLTSMAYLPQGNYGVAVYLTRTPTAAVNIAYSNGPLGPFGNSDITLIPSPATAPGIATLGLFSGSTTASRVWNGQFFYSTGTSGADAGYGFFAPGCAGSLGITNLTNTSRPQVGTTLTVNLNHLPLSAAILMVGFSRTTSGFGPLPLDLTPLGAPGCFGRVSPDVTIFLTGAGNAAAWNLTVPNVPAFIGQLLYNQALVLDPAFNTLGAVVSDAAGMMIGN